MPTTVLRDRILVGLAEWSAESIAVVLADCGAFDAGLHIPELRFFVAGVPPGRNPDTVLAAIRDHPLTTTAHFDVEGGPAASVASRVISNDPDLALQWWLERMGVHEAWRWTRGEGINVAVLDSGLYQGHPDITVPNADQWATGTSSSPAPDIIPISSAAYGHGTACVAMIAATDDNGIGVSGAAPGCRPIVISAGYSVSAMATAIIKAVEMAGGGHGLIISQSWAFSLGTFPDNTVPSSATVLQSAINYAWNAGAVLLASAGNDGYNLDTFRVFPAEMANIVAVGAMQADLSYTLNEGGGEGYSDGAADYYAVSSGPASNYGQSIDIVAPGQRTWTACAIGPDVSGHYSVSSTGYIDFGGTSAACPAAASVAALIWSASPNLTNAEVVAILRETSDPTRNTYGPALTDWNSRFPNAGIAHAGKGVRRALSTVAANANAVYPRLAFHDDRVLQTGLNSLVSTVGGAPRTTLSGSVTADMGGYCNGAAVTEVELWADNTRLYIGPPTRLKLHGTYNGSTSIPIKLIARSGAYSDEEVYTDVLATTLSLLSIQFDGFDPEMSGGVQVGWAYLLSGSKMPSVASVSVSIYEVDGVYPGAAAATRTYTYPTTTTWTCRLYGTALDPAHGWDFSVYANPNTIRTTVSPIATTTYPDGGTSGTTWEVLVPEAEASGTWDAYSSDGDTETLAVQFADTYDTTGSIDDTTVTGSNATSVPVNDYTSGTDTAPTVVRINTAIAVSDLTGQTDSATATVSQIIAASMTAAILLAASIAVVVIPESYTTDSSSAAEAALVAFDWRQTDATTSIDDASVTQEFTGYNSITPDSTYGTDAGYVATVEVSACADVSSGTDAAAVTTTTATETADTSGQSDTGRVNESTVVADVTGHADSTYVGAIVTIQTSATTDLSGQSDAAEVDRSAVTLDTTTQIDTAPAWTVGPSTTSVSVSDLDVSTDAAGAWIGSGTDQLPLTSEWMDVSSTGEVRDVSSRGIVYAYPSSKKEST